MDKIELYSKEVENNILGCIIVFEECYKYIKQLNGKDFFIENNKKIFEVIEKLDKEKKPINLLSLKETAKSIKLDEQKIFNYAVDITSNIITSANIGYYIKKLKNYSTRREIVKKAKKLMDYMYKIDSDQEAGEIKKEAIQELTQIQTANINLENSRMQDVITETIEDIEKRYEKREDNKYKTGFFDLDKITDGLHEQEFTIIAARPGVGKTSFALQLAENIARKGIYTYFISLEMSTKQLGNRLIANKAQIDSHKLRCGWLEEDDFAKIGQTAAELADLKMIIDAKSTTIQEIEIKATELKETKQIGLIIVDYLQLLKSKEKFNIREQEVADISRKLKLLSRELDIPVIALCQLNRETEKRKKPVLADLRESGSLEQDADNVIFLYASEEEKIQKFNMNMDLIVAKQRNGPTGEIRIRFSKKTMKFVNLVGGM